MVPFARANVDCGSEDETEVAAAVAVGSGLKQLITPLLAGLMSNETYQSLSFEAFFTTVQQIVSRSVVYVFHAATCSLLHIYLPPDSRYTTESLLSLSR